MPATPANIRRAYTLVWLLSLGASLALGGCASYSQQFQQIEQKLAQHDPAAALQILEKQRHAPRDLFLFHVNKAMLLHMQGDYLASNVEFEAAKTIIEQFEARSVGEESAAFFINDGTRTYVGIPLEQVMIHLFAAINYLMLEQLDAARVEALQVDIRLRKLAERDPDSVLNIDPFARYLTALVYEQLGEIDNAMIAYRLAYQAYQAHQRAYGLAIPQMLKHDLIRSSKRVGLDNEHAQYLREFGIAAASVDYTAFAQQGELVVFFLKDLAPIKREKRAAQIDPRTGYLIHVSLPYYQRRESPISHARVRVGQQSVNTQLMEDINGIAFKTLDSHMPAIVARAVARAAVKHNVSRKAGEDNALVGLFANLAGVLTERADTRSWLTLPGELHLARVPLTPGDYTVSLELVDKAGQVAATRKLPEVSIRAGHKRYLSYHWISPYSLTRH